MELEMVNITKKEYNKLKMRSEILGDALVQLKMSLNDLRHKRVSKF